MANHGVNYVVITYPSDLAEKALEVLATEFLPHNPLTSGLAEGISEAGTILLDMQDLIKLGVSVAAVEQNSGEVIGVQLNAVRYKDPQDKIPDTQTTPIRIEPYAYKYLETLESGLNFFEQENKYFDLFALIVLKHFGGRGIGSDLVRFSVELARAKYFKLVKTTLSSLVSQHMFRKLDFDILAESKPIDFVDQGKQIFVNCDPDFTVQLVVKRL